MFWRFNLIGIFWALVILVLCLVPGNMITPTTGFWGLGTDKAMHFGLYVIFLVLLAVGFAKQYQYKRIQLWPMRFAPLVAFCYGALIEVVQIPHPSRNFEFMDIVANAVGISLGLVLFRLFYSPRKLV